MSVAEQIPLSFSPDPTYQLVERDTGPDDPLAFPSLGHLSGFLNSLGPSGNSVRSPSIIFSELLVSTAHLLLNPTLR